MDPITKSGVKKHNFGHDATERPILEMDFTEKRHVLFWTSVLRLLPRGDFGRLSVCHFYQEFFSLSTQLNCPQFLHYLTLY